jgi:hypothetical protein
MSHFYNYDTREISYADQIIFLEGKLEEKEREITVLKTILEVIASNLSNYYLALEDDLPLKASSFIQEAVQSCLAYRPRDGNFSAKALKLRKLLWSKHAFSEEELKEIQKRIAEED